MSIDGVEALHLVGLQGSKKAPKGGPFLAPFLTPFSLLNAGNWLSRRVRYPSTPTPQKRDEGGWGGEGCGIKSKDALFKKGRKLMGGSPQTPRIIAAHRLKEWTRTGRTECHPLPRRKHPQEPEFPCRDSFQKRRAAELPE